MEDAPVIYGLEFQARALSSVIAETDAIRFFVGTQTLNVENQIHQIDFDDESNVISKTVYSHQEGEIWQISASPADKSVISTCYNKIVLSKASQEGAIWGIPSVTDSPMQQSGGDSSSSSPPLELLCRLETDHGNTSSIIWEPQGDGGKVVSIAESHVLLWDIRESGTQAKVHSSGVLEGKGHPIFSTVRWNPHHSNSQIATAHGTSIRGWDLRTMKSVYNIDGAHGQLVRDLDFNPNKQYYLVSGGDDCKVKFWDIRNSNQPLHILTDHSHWVWSVRYNHFHDQLLLTSSSDSHVILTNMTSLSSEPFGHLHDDDDDDDDDSEDIGHDTENGHSNKQEPLSDGVLAVYEEHEDSVYMAEWSGSDPWLFASLSYDGRLVINRVPRSVKYRILL